MLEYFEKAWCYILLIILVIVLRKMDLLDFHGNSQIITHFVKCPSYHETCISPTPTNCATYWALSHSIILQTFSK